MKDFLVIEVVPSLLLLCCLSFQDTKYVPITRGDRVAVMINGYVRIAVVYGIYTWINGANVYVVLLSYIVILG